MKKILSLILFATSVCHAQLSEQATISVLSVGPYQGELYSAFGHCAFRVRDPVNNLDVACHYGTFDFNQSNFYLNFAKGYLYFKFSMEDYQPFENQYIYQNRFIHEQVLNLTEQQKKKLFAYLQWNSLPENQVYAYDYFYDNCATKIRDVISLALGHAVTFDSAHIITDYTLRELTDIYLKNQPWGDLGIDLCLGLPADKKATPFEYMFLPEYVEFGLDDATTKQKELDVPLVKEKRITYEARDEETPKALPHPLHVFGLLGLFSLILTFWDFKRKKLSSWFDIILFATTGIIGILLLFLWFLTDHSAAAKNFNLLWAVPTHLIAAVVLLKSWSWLKMYFFGTCILAIITLLSWTFLPQMLHYALIPFVVILGLRSFTQFYFR